MVSLSIRRPTSPLENLEISLIKNEDDLYIATVGSRMVTLPSETDYDAVQYLTGVLMEEYGKIYRPPTTALQPRLL